MNHVCFTALRDGAGLAAELAAELVPGDREPRVYRVEPTGPFEDDPNVTDEKPVAGTARRTPTRGTRRDRRLTGVRPR
jgi:rifampin ADP-ribosylating transferase